MSVSEAGPGLGTPPAAGGWNRRQARELAAMMGAVALLYLAASVQPAIYDETEGQYAGAAREMLGRGDWLIPTNNGIPRFQKPPLVYWSLMLSMGALGVNEFAARLPNALAAIGWVFAAYLLGARVGGHRLGIFGALMLASAAGFFVFCHLIMPEPFLGLFVTLALWTFACALREPDRAGRWFTWGWVFMALGTMAKGLHGAAYPLLTAAACFIMDGPARRRWLPLARPAGPALFLAIVAPWYLAVEARYPGFMADHFLNEQLGHGLNTRWPPTSNQVGLTTFVVQHLFLLMPAALFAPAAGWAWRRCEVSREATRGFKRLLGAWFGVTFLTAAASARQDYYTMSAWPAAAVWLALPWVTRAQIPKLFVMAPCLLLALVGAAGVAGGWFIRFATGDSPVVAAPMVERDHLWTAIQGFSLSAWRAFVPMIIAAFGSMLAGALAAAWFVARHRRAAAGVALAAGMAVPLLMAAEGFTAMEDYFSLARIAKALNRSLDPAGIAVYHGEPNLASSLFFYLDRRVHWVGARPNADFAPRTMGIGRDLYLSEEEFARRWRGPGVVALIAERGRIQEWRARLGLREEQCLPLAEAGTRLVLVNRPPPGGLAADE